MVLLNEPKKLIAITQDTSKNNFIHLRLYIFEHITLKAKRIYATYLAIFVNIFINDTLSLPYPNATAVKSKMFADI